MRTLKTTVVVHRASQKPLHIGLDEAEHDPAEHGAAQVADAAEHRGGEREEAEPEAEVELHRPEVEGVDGPAAPASAPPSANVKEIVRSTLMPIIDEASMS